MTDLTNQAIRVAFALDERGEFDAAMLSLQKRLVDLDQEKKSIFQVMVMQAQLMNRPDLAVEALIGELDVDNAATPTAIGELRDVWRKKGHLFAESVALLLHAMV